MGHVRAAAARGPRALVRARRRVGLLGDHPLRRHQEDRQGTRDVHLDGVHQPRGRPRVHGSAAPSSRPTARATSRASCSCATSASPSSGITTTSCVAWPRRRSAHGVAGERDLDFVDAIAPTTPIAVLARLLDTPEMTPQLIAWGNEIVRFSRPRVRLGPGQLPRRQTVTGTCPSARRSRWRSSSTAIRLAAEPGAATPTTSSASW